MAFIIIRAESQEKILNALADLERHAKLKIKGKPKIFSPELADEVIERILKEKVKWKSKLAVLVLVEQDTTKSILQIRKIHPPAHIVVLSNEYKDYNRLKTVYKELSPLKGYYSSKK
ncbi:MAG TPA: DUF356 domain-containing protein [Methanobacterium sp.]|nr:DUF356 domain-containing protein [Methanobacterium sp.]